MDQKHQYQQRRARESVNTLFELSQLLNTGLDKRTLALCVSLCEQGVNPEVVAVSGFFIFILEYIHEVGSVRGSNHGLDSINLQ